MVPGELDPKERTVPKDHWNRLVGLDDQSPEELKQYCLNHPDAAVQVAAIIGLEKLASKKAILILTERILQGGAWHPTERTLEALVELAPNGGLLALTATLLSDHRNIQSEGAACDAYRVDASAGEL